MPTQKKKPIPVINVDEGANADWLRILAKRREEKEQGGTPIDKLRTLIDTKKQQDPDS